MTMLDRMRRHKGWLKWSLGIVVVTFVLLYVPAFLRGNGGDGTSLTDAIASVDGHDVTVGEYRRAYDTQVAAMRANAGGDVDDNMLKQLQVPQRIVQELLDQQAMLAQADHLGLRVSDGELRTRIMKMPNFQENGQFIGEAKYRQLLDMQRPPLTEADFEAEMRTTLLAEKLQAAVTGWMRVTDAEVDDQYRKTNEKVKVDLALFTAAQYRANIQPTDAELAAQFSAHPDLYKMPEKRRVRYLSVDAQALKAKQTVTPQEIQQRYQQNASMYSTPEQIRASHILFKTDGKNDDAQKKKAEDVLAKVKAGGDFAALAKQYSEDDGSKANGGDLDYFGKGTMYKEFEDAAWNLKPGEVSGLVKSPAGWHIIKFVDRRPATTKTLAEVTPQLQDQIKTEKAQAEAQKVAEDIAKDITSPADLDKEARARGLTVGDSGLFSRDEPLAGLGFAPAVSASAISLQQGKVSGLLRTNTGFAIIALTEIKPSYVPQLSEVKDKVKEDVVRLKALDVAKSKAAAMAKAGDFAAAAKAAGADVKSTDFITRDSAYPEIGVNSSVDAIAFNLKPGETSAPIPTDTAVVVVHVKDKQAVDPAKMIADRDLTRDQLLSQRRQEFFSAYMQKARQGMKITFNEAAIKTVLGG